MKIGVSLNINVSKIDKNKMFKGEKGTYLNATAFIDTDQLDQYGNSGMITQDVGKNERDSGAKGEILGNAKVFWKDTKQDMQQGQPASAPAPSNDFEQDIPF